MKALILAGGFAKRMGGIGKSKVLLEINSVPILDHVINKIEPIDEVDTIYIATNEVFRDDFQEWLKTANSSKFIKLVFEKTKEGEKLGSIGALKNFVDEENINETLLVVAGDNMLESGLFGFMQFFRNHNAPVIGLYDVKSKERAKHLGVVEIDDNSRIIDFIEKPGEPKSTLSSTGIYILPPRVLSLLRYYVNEKMDMDNFGSFIQWLFQKERVLGFVFNDKWFDIGTPETFEDATKFFETQE